MNPKKGGQRQLYVRVKSRRKRSASSRRWLERQLNDPYVAAARRHGVRSRSAYKLLEIDRKYHFLKPGFRIVDLGAAPGGWSQVCADRVQSKTGEGQVISVDCKNLLPLPGVDFVKMNFLDQETQNTLLSKLRKGQADAVLSDMAAETTGHARTDHLRTMNLAQEAANFAHIALAKNGSFLCKVLQGGTENTLLCTLKNNFDKVRHVKPPASRSDSCELYVLATRYQGK